MDWIGLDGMVESEPLIGDGRLITLTVGRRDRGVKVTGTGYLCEKAAVR